MSNQYNPFNENRTEQMEDLWKYYVPFNGLVESGKPLVVEGGRGSGKTMFFQCNSWREKCVKLRKSEKPLSELLNDDFIGLYYRVDTTFVSSMRNGEEENWGGIFETYLSICILMEIIDLINEISPAITIDEKKLIAFAQLYSGKICRSNVVDNISLLKMSCTRCLDAIEDKINGVGDYSEMRRVFASRFIRDVCLSVGDLFNHNGLRFKVFIDEYETLLEYQQKIVNTLIKHSALPVIFNVGVKPRGMRTQQTISPTETIEDPHDYKLVELGFGDKDQYAQLLKDICRKRIKLGKDLGKIPENVSDDIEYYLGNYSIDEEMNLIRKSKRKFQHVSDLRELIRVRGKEESLSDSEIDEYISLLCDKSDVLYSRIYYAILKKKTQYTPKIAELCKELAANSSRYQEWIHNRKNGAIYLLCKETKRKKMYFGFDVYSMLSSYNVRCFLELCEQAFKFSFLNDYQWDHPISIETQTEAANFVSDYKITDIAGYEPYGNELRIFVQYLGSIFYSLHTEKDSTIGEPEPNHFSTKDLSLTKDLRDKINSALLCNVLQEGEANKKKRSMLSPETVDYHLNKIYTPYFGISYRDIRKIDLPVEILELLLDGDEKKANKAITLFSKTQKIPFVSKQMEISDLSLEEESW